MQHARLRNLTDIKTTDGCRWPNSYSQLLSLKIHNTGLKYEADIKNPTWTTHLWTVKIVTEHVSQGLR